MSTSIALCALLLTMYAAPADSPATTPVARDAAPAQTAIFKAGTSSSGWIDFVHYKNLGIYVPVTINGHSSMALLWGGPSSIDAAFAASIGLQANANDASVRGVDIQIGDLTLHDASAKPDDLKAQTYAAIIGQPLPFRLGEEMFDQLAVDIDFAHHRIAFLDPKTVTKPAGATEVPLTELDGERVVPVSVDGAAPAEFEFELGNVIGPLLVTPAYAQAHKLLEGHPTSTRLSGSFTETVVSLDHLGFAGIDFPGAPIAIVPESQLPPVAITGGAGLPLFDKFRLIVDYPHDRLYAIPDPVASKTPIPKDRIGLVLRTKGSNFVVAFVSAHSPAETAGFKKGDEIVLIDGKPLQAWPGRDIASFRMADVGTVHVFTMTDGSVRQINATDFF
jgi:hypothetical protein